MKKRFMGIIAAIVAIFCGFFVFSACANDSYQQDTYKNYKSSELEVKGISVDEEALFSFGYNRMELISDYQSYIAYSFHLGYTESYFESNDLLIFVVECCTSDQMTFDEILENEKQLYPLFSRKKIDRNQVVTSDSIIMSYCSEVTKKTEYKIGEIIYRYK